jgi:hypothetical protein
MVMAEMDQTEASICLQHPKTTSSDRLTDMHGRIWQDDAAE